jgi:hypothetical protein
MIKQAIDLQDAQDLTGAGTKSVKTVAQML